MTARAEARKAKDFATADRVRQELEQLGIWIMDSPQGTTWRPGLPALPAAGGGEGVGKVGAVATTSPAKPR